MLRAQSPSLALALGLILSAGNANPASAHDAITSEQASYLFVFDGRNAELRPVRGTPDTCELTVPMMGNNHLVAWFTDRPVRDTGHTTMRNFVELWQEGGEDSFAVDPPNAAIAFNQRTLITTMTDPKIVKIDNGGKALKSTMTLVKGKALSQLLEENLNLAAQVKRASGNSFHDKRKLPTISVFVDSSQSPYSDSTHDEDDRGQDHDETQDDTINS